MAEFSLLDMGKRLKQVRTEKGFGGERQLREFCREYGWNPSVWGQLEKGEKKTLYLQSIVDLANDFNISPTWLLFDQGKMKLDEIGLGSRNDVLNRTIERLFVGMSEKEQERNLKRILELFPNVTQPDDAKEPPKKAQPRGKGSGKKAS